MQHDASYIDNLKEIKNIFFIKVQHIGRNGTIMLQMLNLLER